MLGRRGIRIPRGGEDQTERVRRRAIESLAERRRSGKLANRLANRDEADHGTGHQLGALDAHAGLGPSNQDLAGAQAHKVSAPDLLASQSQVAGQAPGHGPGQAKVIPFSQTPIYRVHGHEGLPSEIVFQVFDVLSDRLEEPDLDLAARSQSYLDQVREAVEALTVEILDELDVGLSLGEQVELADRLMDEAVGLGPVQALIEDDSVNDILVNGPDRIYVERRGRLHRTDCRFRSTRHLARTAQRIARQVKLSLSERSPIVDARLPDGSRVNIVDSPPAVDGTVLSIRKPKTEAITLERMVRQGNLSASMAELLAAAVRDRLNIVIVGASGSGKTTFLNALAECFEEDERIVAIEEVSEVRAVGRHLVNLECHPPHSGRDDGRAGEVTQRDLLRNALRMNPDRLVMGEVRGDEVVELLQAMVSGHDGVLGTLHAGGSRAALQRLETLLGLAGIDGPVDSMRGQIARAVDLVVTLARADGGPRRVVEITEVLGLEGDIIVTQPLFDYEVSVGDPQQGTFRASGLLPRFAERVGKADLDTPRRRRL